MKPNLLLVVFLMVFPLIFSGQPRWVRTYFNDWNLSNYDILESYDQGYIFGVNCLSRSGYHTKILKLDINGEALWEKVVKYHGPSLAAMKSMAQNDMGEILFAGAIQQSGHDPVIIKLNACGELLWCSRITTTISNDEALKICPLDDGGCMVSIRNGGFAWDEDRVCLMQLDANGNFQWQKCYNGLDSNIWFMDHEGLIRTHDQGYLITGECQYSDTTPIVYNRGLAYLIKTDSGGEVQWEFILDRDSSENHGEAHMSQISPDGNSYYTSLTRWLDGPEDYGRVPALLKTGLSGNKIAVYDLKPPGESSAGMYDFVFLNPNLIAAIIEYNVQDETVKRIALMDTLGNILKEAEFLEETFNEQLIKDEENKLLLFTRKLVEENNTDLFLLKYSETLMNDTLYLQPFDYDTLCPYPILHDTLFLDDCDVIVDVDEVIPGQQGQTPIISAWPNPCTDQVTFSFNDAEGPDRIDFFNVYGQHIYSHEIMVNENQVTINTAAFPSGLIVAVLRRQDHRFLVTKIIKL